MRETTAYQRKEVLFSKENARGEAAMQGTTTS